MKNYSFGHFLVDVFLTFITAGLWLVLRLLYWLVLWIRQKMFDHGNNLNNQNNLTM